MHDLKDLSVSIEGDVLLVRLEGELDLNTAPKFRAAVEETIGRRPHLLHLVLDLTGVTFVDSSGLGAILGRYRQFAERGGRVVVIGLQPSVRRLFELSGLFRVVETATSYAEAKARLKGGAAVER
ncbi:MAG: anti-sigma factor antagonist [Limnochordales bacterium]|nr:anti-sigma factor antagonist [Limnochordales bacterium]